MSAAVIAIVLAFYSPCQYELPRRHLAETLAWAASTGHEVVLAQAVRPGQTPEPAPPGVRSLVYKTMSTLFYKENLWNLAAAATQADELLCVDADVSFSAADVVDQVSEQLKVVDVLQPFKIASWLDQTGCPFQARRASAYALASGWEPRTLYYHPGFSWAMRRSAFDALGGFYDKHPTGGGDVAFTYSLDARWADSKLPRHVPLDAGYWHSPSYKAYQANGVSLGLRVGYLADVTAYHRWHGEIVRREYATRGRFLTLAVGEDYRLTRRPDGLLEWDLQEDSDAVLAYFRGRREDGDASHEVTQ